MARRTTIADLKHRVALCAGRDVLVSPSEIALVREEVARRWARIEERRGSLMFNGAPLEQPNTARTHRITLRYDAGLDVTATAWVYEERRQSQPRWFKVLSTQDLGEAGEWLVLDCRLTNREDFVTEPVRPGAATPAVPLPEGVTLE